MFWETIDQKIAGSAPYQAMGKTPLRTLARDSMMNAMGFDIAFSGENRGFLGLKSNIRETYGLGRSGGMAPGMRDIYRVERQAGASAGKAMGTALKGAGGKAASLAFKTGLAAIGPAWFAHEVYTGYKEGGIIGAAGGAATYIGVEMGMRAVIGMIGTPLTIAAAATAAVGYGAYKLGEAGKRYERQLRNLEMGGDENMMNAIESYGANTMRQRAAVAMNNSHINRRLALGNEAALFHSSFR